MHLTPTFSVPTSARSSLRNLGGNPPIARRSGGRSLSQRDRAWHDAVNAFLFGGSTQFRWLLANRRYWQANRSATAPVVHRTTSRVSRAERRAARKAATKAGKSGDDPEPPSLPLIVCDDLKVALMAGELVKTGEVAGLVYVETNPTHPGMLDVLIAVCDGPDKPARLAELRAIVDRATHAQGGITVDRALLTRGGAA